MTIIVTVAPTGAAAVVHENWNHSSKSEDGLRSEETYRNARYLVRNGETSRFSVTGSNSINISEVDKDVKTFADLDEPKCVESISHSAQVNRDIDDAGLAAADKPVVPAMTENRDLGVAEQAYLPE